MMEGNTCSFVDLKPPYYVTVDIEVIYESKKHKIEANGFNIINRGNTILYIDDKLTLLPSQSWSCDAQNYDIISQEFYLRFGTVAQDVNPLSNRIEIITLKKGNRVVNVNDSIC